MKADGRRHTPADLYHERTEFDFTGRSWRWLVLSGSLMLVAIVAIVVNGLNLGLDFKGGTSLVVTTTQKAPKVVDVENVLRSVDLGSAKIQVLGGNTVRVETKTTDPTKQQTAAQKLATYAGVEVKDVSVSTVGPTWGKQVTRRALIALLVFFLLVAVFLAIFFEWQMALAAIVAVVHDVIFTVGFYALFNIEVAPATVIAFLTILGFSLYDTVVVFDKIKENRIVLGSHQAPTYAAMVNISMNQVLMRSLNTSLIALLPVAGLLGVGVFALGARSLLDFSVALFVGLFIGAYSSIFVAAPLLSWIKEREPDNRRLRERWEAQGSPRPTGTITSVDQAEVAAEDAQDDANAVRAVAPSGITPRARKRRR